MRDVRRAMLPWMNRYGMYVYTTTGLYCMQNLRIHLRIHLRTVVLVWVVCVFITRNIEEFLSFHNDARANLRVRLQTCGFIWVVCFLNSPSWHYPTEPPPSTSNQTNRLPIRSASLCRYPLHESINQSISWREAPCRTTPHHTIPQANLITEQHAGN